MKFESAPPTTSRMLVDLPNISFVLMEHLASIGITQPEQLRELGAVKAWSQLRSAGHLTDARTLLALEGAVQGIRWQSLAPPIRRRLIEHASTDHAAY